MCEGARIRLRGSWEWAPIIVGTSLCCGPALAASEAMTAAEIEVLGASISKCWRPPDDSRKGPVVRVRVEMTADGSLAAPPRILNRQPSDLYERTAETVLKALRDCQPYQVPWEGHDSWKTMIMNFDPRVFHGSVRPAAEAGPPREISPDGTPPGSGGGGRGGIGRAGPDGWPGPEYLGL